MIGVAIGEINAHATGPHFLLFLSSSVKYEHGVAIRHRKLLEHESQHLPPYRRKQNVFQQNHELVRYFGSKKEKKDSAFVGIMGHE